MRGAVSGNGVRPTHLRNIYIPKINLKIQPKFRYLGIRQLHQAKGQHKKDGEIHMMPGENIPPHLLGTF